MSKTGNGLVKETSPYLQQHAYNPVLWQPWSQEILEKAQKLDKPIFLSIGYSTCHWCHVMEDESFSDMQVAALLNQHFICIKVDREERPDIDALYMKAAQATGTSGGWPLNLFLTPEAKPYFATTYIPKNASHNRPGMMGLIPQAARVWKEKKEDVLADSDKICQSIAQVQIEDNGIPLLSDFDAFWKKHYDKTNGGFGGAPKFASPHNLIYALHRGKTQQDQELQTIASYSLTRFRQSGLWDHIGKGFMRYSTDESWTIPHFEKMLYDNAMLFWAYSEAADTDNSFLNTASEILEYLNTQMKSSHAGWHAAEDADTQGEEGKFYLWNASEIEHILGAEAKWFCEYYNCNFPEGNFAEINQPPTGLSHLHTTQSLLEFAKAKDIPLLELEARQMLCLMKLQAYRANRIPPFTDRKVLADWNGLTLASLARAARLHSKEDWADNAEQQANALWSIFWKEQTLFHYSWDGIGQGQVQLDDYCYWIWACLELYLLKEDSIWKERFLLLEKALHRDFPAQDGLHPTHKPDEFFTQTIDSYDGAIPSGNGILQWALLRWNSILERTSSDSVAQLLTRAQQYPLGHAMTGICSLWKENGTLVQKPSSSSFPQSALCDVISWKQENWQICQKQTCTQASTLDEAIQMIST